MNPIAIQPGDEEPGALHDIPHGELMFDALSDTLDGVAGAEGLGLTQAQVYAHAVLGANGMLKPSIAGNEGFFSSISNAVKATYEYIVKMFKSIWGFFFSRDAAVEAKEAKEEVRVIELKLEKIGNPTPESVAEAEKIMAYVHKRVADFKSGKATSDDDTIDLDNDTLDDIKRKLAGNASEQKAGVKELMDVMPKANKPAQAKFKKAAEGVVTLNKKFDAMMSTINVRPKGQAPLKPKAGSIGIAISQSIGAATRAYEPSVKQNIDNLIKFENIKDKAHAVNILNGIKHDIEAGEKLANALKGHTSQLGSEIHHMESALKSGPLSDEDKNELEVLRVVLSMGTTVAQYLKRVVEAQKHLANTVGNVFGL